MISNKNSTVKYMNVVDPYDHHAIESYYKTYIYSCNFINTNHVGDAVFWCPTYKGVKFDTCVFINSHSKFSAKGTA